MAVKRDQVEGLIAVLEDYLLEQETSFAALKTLAKLRKQLQGEGFEVRQQKLDRPKLPWRGGQAGIANQAQLRFFKELYKRVGFKELYQKGSLLQPRDDKWFSTRRQYPRLPPHPVHDGHKMADEILDKAGDLFGPPQQEVRKNQVDRTIWPIKDSKVGLRMWAELDGSGGFFKVDRLATVRKLLKAAKLLVKRGPSSGELTWQAPFEATTPCVKCGRPARLGITLQETGSKGDDFVCNVHPNDCKQPPKTEGWWIHDAAAFAIYLCNDVKCATATCLWNQG